jgi:predicted SAM-dependent methyltransferase
MGDRNVSRRLHIGGHTRTPGWEVLDANPGPSVDHVGNAADLSRFAENSFEQIYASHVLEHFAYLRRLVPALIEWRRVLRPSGTLFLSVPDLDVLARLFVDRGNLSVEERFLVMRMIFGGQADEHDYHLAGLNEEFLTSYLTAAQFTGIRRVDNFGLFDDTSTMELKGTRISLNMIAVK